MAPKKTERKSGKSSTGAVGARRVATPTQAQAQLKAIDAQLMALLNQRVEWTRRLAESREKGSAPDPSVELDERTAMDLAQKNAPSLTPQQVQVVFREIHSVCRAVVRRLRVAFLGPAYSYTHLAAIRRFGSAAEWIAVATISAVFEEVRSGNAELGVVPIENSTDGRVTDTLDMFTKMPLRICGQIELAIHHTLLANCARDSIREVCSKPQALSQCRNWLAKHLPAARMVEVASTSVAAEIASRKEGAAAIASREAGMHYGLNVLAERIEDNPGNVTRFAVIGNQAAQRTGNDRTAVLFQTEHRFGTLVDALATFKRNNINMTWIESFPVPGTDRAYLFFVELEGHERELRMRRALDALRRRTIRLDILGSFPTAATEGA